MFTAGRILRKKDSVAAICDDRLASSAYSRERRKFRCYFPFVRQSVLASVAGFVVMATGLSFCIVGFSAGHDSEQQEQQQSEERETSNETDEVQLLETLDMFDFRRFDGASIATVWG